jgi:CheY-like chemotaxis protein
LTVESTLGQGSCFTITLPLAIAQEPDTILKNPLQTANDNSAGRHVLLAEDNSGNILVATCLLATYGYSYDLARNGKEALAMLDANTYDVVLMDVQMPEMDGLEVTRRLREREKATGSERLPVIGMTAYALPEDRRRCLQAGMDGYIAKPFNHQELVNILQRVIKPAAVKPVIRLLN